MGAVEEREGPWRVDEVLTLPNALSLLRLLGVPLFLWAILTGRDGLALITLMASGITDYLDGKPKSNPFPPDTPEHDGYGDGYDDPR